MSKFKKGDKVVIRDYSYSSISGSYWKNDMSACEGKHVTLTGNTNSGLTTENWWYVIGDMEAEKWIWPESSFRMVKDVQVKPAVPIETDLIFFRTSSHPDVCKKCAAPLPCNYHS